MKNTEPRKKFNFLKISLYFFYLIFVLAIILLLLINKKTNVNCLVVIAALIVFVIINLIIHHTLLKNISSAYDEIDESHKMQSTFFSNLTHNLNTPLNVILTLDEIIIRNSDSEEIKNYAQNIYNSGKELQACLSSLLDYSSIGSTKRYSFSKEFPVEKTFNFIIARMEENCQRNNNQFSCSFSQQLPEHLIGDPIVMSQVLNLLFGIIVKDSFDSNISLTATWHPQQKKPMTTEVLMDNKIVSKTLNTNGALQIIFKSSNCNLSVSNINGFFQSQDSKSGKVSVNNDSTLELTLNLVNELLKKIGGSAYAFSRGGTTFELHIEFPFIGSINLISIQKICRTERSNNQKESKSFTAPDARILTVDDVEENNMIICSLLKSTKIKIDTASNAQEALKLISEHTYNLILVDYMMPDVNGIELLNLIRSGDFEHNKNVPVIAISADTTNSTIYLLQNAGFSEHLSKPIRKAELLFAIKKHLPENLCHEMDIQKKAFNNYDAGRIQNYLAKYDISFEEGMKYMNDDFSQYIFVSDIICASKDSLVNKFHSFEAQKDYENLKISVHALKGNAKYIGASALYYTCQSLETKLTNSEYDFTAVAMPLIYYQLEQMISGLSVLVSKYNQSINNENINSELLKGADKADYLSEICEYIDNYEPNPAKKLINILLEMQITKEEKAVLDKVYAYLDELEYDLALDTIKEITND